jgi:hypothetical protein
VRRPTIVWILGVLIATMLIAASPLTASAAPVRFGAKLTNESQPTGAESCDHNAGIPNGAVCTWIAQAAFENGDHQKAPKTGTIGKVRLISCTAGHFTLQIARVRPAEDKAKVVRNGPRINYAADPRQVDGNPDTFCGGDNGDNYIIQSFSVNVHVDKGDYIGAKAKKLGFIHNSGGGPTMLYSPPLSPGGGFIKQDDDTSADLMLQLQYK